jgi:hypothetical protein
MKNGTAAVKRAAGFTPDFEYVAEVTLMTPKGMVTARDGSHTADGAVFRATERAKSRLSFAGWRRPVGFAPA